MRGWIKKLKSVYKNLSIKKKFLLLLYVQILIPLILIGFMSYKISSNIIEKKSMAYSQDILHMIELRLKDYVYNLSIISQDLIYDRKVYSILKNDSMSRDLINEYENRDAINNILKKVVLSRNEVQSICFMSNSGSYYYFDNNSNKGSIRYTAPFEKIQTKAREGYGRIVWYLDSKDHKVENVYLARTIYDQDNFREIGLMVMMVKKGFLETVYQDLETKNMQNVAIISDSGDLIVSRNPDSSYLLDLNKKEFYQDRMAPAVDKTSGTIVSYITLNQPKWRIFTYISSKELYKEIGTLRQWIIALSLLSVAILSLLSISIAMDFIRPINRLVKGMAKLQKGGEKVYIDEDRKDELGFLNKAFNTLAEEIHHLLTWVYREQITRKEAEIKALQSQINPHFLFNTLESINWMAQLNNIPEISETVSDLSSLMEASIGRDDKLITLREEFNYTDRYIALLKRRFSDKIELVKDIQPETLKIKIPRLLIQPLIENSVYHGIEKSRGKGIINLKAYIRKEMLVIEVKDNGLGVDKDRLAELNERLSMDNDTYFKNLGSKTHKSIGIENVNRRIKLFYGEAYGLEIRSEAGEYTKVIVSIPLEQSERKEGYYVQGNDHR